MKLLASQRRQCAKLIRDAGFNLEEFNWMERQISGGELVEILFHDSGETDPFEAYQIQFLKDEICLSPAGESIYECIPAQSWERKFEIVDRWLSYLRRELENQDPFAKRKT
jgi:hypothetical protein